MNISQVAALYELTPATLRYYEKHGLMPTIKRNDSGNREYSKEDLIWLEFIKCMRNAGLPVKSLAKYAELYQQGNATLEKRKQILVSEYNKLQEKQVLINQTMSRLGHKIDSYEVKIKNYNGEF